jgi:hypothetical protein
MFTALAYKEWLKTRWFFLGSAVIGFASIITVLLKLGAYFEFNSASAFWNYVVIKGYLYYGDFKYVPLAIALIIAGAQYVPEFSNYKLKLTLHLPVEETRLLFYMVGYGTLLLFILDVVFLLLLILISATYFPSEVVTSMIYTVLPWILAGFSAYYFTAAVLIEPLWNRRIILAVFGYGFFSQLMISADYMAYKPSLPYFFLMVLLQFSLIFLSGFRFKRGAR